MKECQVCANIEIKPLFIKDGFPYQRCPKCGLIRIEPQPANEQLDAIYNGKYYDNWGGEESVFINMKKKTFFKILEFLPNVKNENPKPALLDIGAATGILMEVACEKGYDVYGIEAAKDGAKIICEKFGQDKIVNGYFDESFGKWQEGSFDIIVMCDFFEHVKNPKEVLKKTYALLRQNGKLILHLPDAGSMARAILKKRWTNFIPEHLFSFSQSNIKIILKNTGFSINMIKTEKKYLNVQYAQNVLHYYAKFGGGGVVFGI
ncbi:MAG: class I SAM-dependent methyltransferase [Elusimicrobiota bacterium]|jgi:2-polyprenyl-3-methyl-5-hydroxy-6-metoxy-1,4-benzoquinol methylase|nr:class I SAM-dependent methyltransferase [Elusimicrobiota bacterium]